MQRFLKTFAIVTLLTSVGGIGFAPRTALAADPASQQAFAACNKYAGTYHKNKDTDRKKLAQFNKLSCDAYCTKSGDDTVKVTCKQPTSTPPCTDNCNGGTDSGGGDDDAGATVDPAIAYAETQCNEDQCSIISKFVNPIIDVLTILVGLAIVIGIIFGGIQVSTSGGDPQKAASGKDHIRNALIAMVTYLLLFGFLSWLVPGGIV